MVENRIILDVDVGSDDALALLVLLFAELYGLAKIEAITCVTGNTKVENVVTNVVRVLEAAKRTDIPVYKGANSSFIAPEINGDGYYGEDGFGDIDWGTVPDLSVVRPEIAALAIGTMITENPGEIYVLACGPVTNIALAMKLFPNFARDVKGIHVMGGNHNGVGNISPAAEFNFYLDPEAAAIVFQNGNKMVNLLTWETTLDSVIDIDWRFNVLGAISNPVLDIITQVDHTVFPSKSKVYKPADAFMVAAFLFPEKMIKLQESYPAEIELHGSRTRGQVVIDHENKTTANVMFIKAIDREYFMNLLIDVANSTRTSFNF